MAKKIISIVLSVLFVFSTFAICSFATGSEVITDEDRDLYPAEELAITDPKDRIDRALLTGRYAGTGDIASTAASEDILEDNLSYWKDEIIEEYHALAAKGDDATDAEWGALYRKMKTPHDNDFDNYGDYWYEYKDLTKGTATVNFVASKTEVQPGEEFTVDVYLTTDFWFSAMYATIFYDNSVVDIVGCSESYRGTLKENGHSEDITVHELGEDLSSKFEYNESNHYGDYDLAVYGDMREQEWPDSLKAEEGCYDKYEGYNVTITPIVAKSPDALKCDNTKIITLKFKAKDDATAGSTSALFCPNDAMYSLSKLDLYDEYYIMPCWQFYRCDKGTKAAAQQYCDEMYQFDKTLDITGTSVTIVSDEAETADYTALDAAIADFNSGLSGLYTTASWKTYASAVTAGSAVSRDLLKEDQATVDAAAKAITDAKEALVLNNLISASLIGTPTIGTNANVQVAANGSPKVIRLVGADGNSLTFDRQDATITSNGDNEIWNIKVAATSASATYTVYAKYGDEYNTEGVALEIIATDGLDLSVHSVSVPDMYPTGSYMDGKIYAGVHDVIVRTSTDVFKIQFIDPDGNTRTFSSVDYQPVVDGEELVWTLPVNFSPLGTLNLGLRTRAENTTFALTGDYITGRVVY